MSANRDIGSEQGAGPSGQDEEAGSGMFRDVREGAGDAGESSPSAPGTVEEIHSTVRPGQVDIDVVDVDHGMPLVMPPGTGDEPLADHSDAGGRVIQAGGPP